MESLPFALLGYKNHELYFGHLGGEGGEPEGRFAEVVEDEFRGGVREWQQAIRNPGARARLVVRGCRRRPDRR